LNPSDRRAKQISLSPAGEAFIEKAIAERSCWVDELAASLNAEERQKVADVLQILTEAAKTRKFLKKLISSVIASER
jgi:DNA-binding MarR family transcriptional regulator